MKNLQPAFKTITSKNYYHAQKNEKKWNHKMVLTCCREISLAQFVLAHF